MERKRRSQQKDNEDEQEVAIQIEITRLKKIKAVYLEKMSSQVETKFVD